MTKTEMKLKAQEILIDTLGNAAAKVYEGSEGEGLTEEEKTALIQELQKQGDRIAKMFGYERIYFY